MDLTAVELRVLGCLVEKAMTTPEHYPLTTNALVAAANQASNRDPVLDLSEAEVMDAMASLRERDLARSVKRPGDRVMKHRHDLDRTLGVDAAESAVLAVLMLRGAQTPGELRARTDRYEGADDDVEMALDRLARREVPLTASLERRPGQKESRWVQLLGEAPDEPTAAVEAVQVARPGLAALEDRVAVLEATVARLREELGL